MKTKLVLLFFSIFPFMIFSQISVGLGMGKSEADGTIYYKNGTSKQGTIKYPNQFDKNVSVDSEKIETESIDSIVYVNPENNQRYTFVFTKGKDFVAPKKAYKTFKNPAWMCKIMDGDVSLFVFGQQYGFKDNKIFVNKGDVRYYALRNSEDYPTLIGIDSQGLQAGFDALFRRLAENYFSDTPQMKNKIENKEYSIKDVESMISDYNNM